MKQLRRAFFVFCSVFCFLQILASSSWASGQPPKTRNFGLGIEVGSPTALTGKYWYDPGHAVDMGLGYWFGNYIEIFGDYLWHWPRAFSGTRDPGPEFVPYIGVGGEFHVANGAPPVTDNNHPTVGIYARIPFGMEWLPPRAPVGIFLEIVPAIQIIPGIYVAFGADIGARFYF